MLPVRGGAGYSGGNASTALGDVAERD